MPRGKTDEVKERLVKLLSDGRVYTAKQIMNMFGLTHTQVYYLLRRLEDDGKATCRVLGTWVLLCGAVDKFIDEYTNAVKKALEDLTAGCKTRCCAVRHAEVLKHPAVEGLIWQLGFATPRSIVVQTLSLDIITQYMKLPAYRRTDNSVVFKICRVAEESGEDGERTVAEIFAEICKMASKGSGSRVGLKAVKVAESMGDMRNSNVIKIAATLKALCKKLGDSCTKWNKTLYYFERNALLQLCASGQLLETSKPRRYGIRKPHNEPLEIVSAHVEPTVLKAAEEVARGWGMSKSDIVRYALELLLERYRDAQLADRIEVRPEALRADDERPVNVLLTKQMRRDLEEVARNSGYTMSAIVREAIARLLEKWRGRV